MASPIVSLFKEQLENESRKLAAANNLEKRGDFLIWWYFERLVGLSSAEIEEVICDGSADLGVDAIWIDDDNVVHFYSFKNPASIEAGFAGGDVDKTLAGLNVILARKHYTIANEELRGRIEEIYQTVPAGYRLHLVTSGAGLSDESETKLKVFVESLGGPSETFFKWDLEDIRRLQDIFYRKHLPTVEEPIDFQLDFSPYQVRSANHDSYIFHSSGKFLAELYERHGEQLLQQNIRVYQGDNATNSLIRKSATGSESANFLHYNNGITFLCESAGWDGFTRKLTLKKAQVVNGGQTIRVLQSANSAGDLRQDVSVPVRVITSQGDKEFASNVAVNLNNQNRIEPSFLRSNEPRVVQLANALASMGWYLERREAEVDTLTPAEKSAIESQIGARLDDRLIRLKEGAQAYVATYMRQPELAKKNPKRIFLSAADGGYFDRIFSSDLTAERFVAAHRLAQCIGEYVRQFMTRKRRKERVPDWRSDYAALLGDDFVPKHGSVVDQVIPQSAIFLMAAVYELRVVLQGRSIEDVIEELGRPNFSILNELLSQTISFAAADQSFSKSWPTLLKSQAFFEKFTSYLRGRETVS
jgi:AIPR protein